MRLIGGFSVNEKEFAIIKRKMIRFYESEKTCSELCPMFRDDHVSYYGNDRMEPALRKLEKRMYDTKLKCLCNLFEELQETNIYVCPCRIYGKKAFERLERVVKKLQDPEIFKDRR